MTPLNRSIFSFVGYHLALFSTLGLLVACSAQDQVNAMPTTAPVAQVNPPKEPALADIGANRFHLAPLPKLSPYSSGNVLHDRQNEVACYFVLHGSEPVFDCVKL